MEEQFPLHSDEELEIIDTYNKLKLLIKIFEDLMLKLKTKENDPEMNDIVFFYESLYTLYFSKEKVFPDNENEILSILFTNKSEFFDDCQNKIDQDQMKRVLNLKLLSLFEEEVKLFLKNKNNLLKFFDNKDKCVEKSSSSIKSNITQEEEQMILRNFQNLYQEIFNLLVSNFEILNSLFENLKNSEIETSKEDIENKYKQFIHIKDLMDNIVGKIISELTSEQHILTLEKIKQNLQEKKEKELKEIQELKQRLNHYADQGEELTDLVKEYRKLCTLLENKK
jgi:hypothetical protein